MQECHDEEYVHNCDDNQDQVMTIHSKKGHRLSHSAKKFLKSVRKNVDSEIQEI